MRRIEHRPPINHPEAEEVCLALHQWTAKFSSQRAAAVSLGIPEQCLSDYRHGKRRMPEWISEMLGYKLEYVKLNGPVGVMLAETEP